MTHRLEIRPCQAGDVLAFTPQPDQAWDVGVDLRALECYRPAGLAWTFLRRSEVIAVGGFMPRFDGVVHAWSLIGAPRRAEWAQLIGFAAERLDAAARLNRRIEAFCRADRPRQIAALERLGFKQETPAPMAGFHPVHPCIQFARAGRI